MFAETQRITTGLHFLFRDDAMRKTKTLQTQIMTENAKVGSLMRYFS